jgi:hypothetical protein
MRPRPCPDPAGNHIQKLLSSEKWAGKEHNSLAAIAAGRNARRTIVLCPPHLVDKWQREFKAVWPGVRTMHLQTISDVDQFFADQPDDAPLVGVLKQTTARSASGWEHAYDYAGPASHSYGSQGYTRYRTAVGQRAICPQIAGPYRSKNGRCPPDG